ncbi:secreted RxLR effector protein 161-like [Lathyrus oleraceus]|uniref:secreted RxLR effector protein 161-like n=1 Tax=Pisum sativum TaxID=3888 RepID=UPI0021D07D5D|nr:secreted RxLR effector protein 161-like [Pisum sativum]
MHAEFEMSLMGKLKFFLGIQINQSLEGTYIHQSKYTNELPKKFDMSECKMSKTPMHPTCILEKEEVFAKVEHKVYIGMIGSLLYLTASRPDILFTVSLFSCFQSYPRESHLIAVKRIFRYLKGMINLGSLYRKSKDYKLLGYYDVEYAGERLERKRTSGSCHFLGDSLISWSSKRQSTIALSTIKVEYIAASKCNTQMLYMKS